MSFTKVTPSRTPARTRPSTANAANLVNRKHLFLLDNLLEFVTIDSALNLILAISNLPQTCCTNHYSIP
jgi:hypothetical protein